MNDYCYCIKIIKTYCDKIKCKRYGQPFYPADIKKIFDRILVEDFNIPILSITSITLEHPNIVRIIYDCTLSLCMLSHEFDDYIVKDYITRNPYHCRFDYPDYIFPTERDVIENLIFEAKMQKMENMFNKCSVKDNLDEDIVNMFQNFKV